MVLTCAAGGDHVDTANTKYTKSGGDLQGVNISHAAPKCLFRIFAGIFLFHFCLIKRWSKNQG
jgi:hypothetical protein